MEAPKRSETLGSGFGGGSGRTGCEIFHPSPVVLPPAKDSRTTYGPGGNGCDPSVVSVGVLCRVHGSRASRGGSLYVWSERETSERTGTGRTLDDKDPPRRWTGSASGRTEGVDDGCPRRPRTYRTVPSPYHSRGG